MNWLESLKKALWGLATFLVGHYAWQKQTERAERHREAQERLDSDHDTLQRLRRAFIVLATRERLQNDLIRRLARAVQEGDLALAAEVLHDVKGLRESSYMARHLRLCREGGVRQPRLQTEIQHIAQALEEED